MPTVTFLSTTALVLLLGAAAPAGASAIAFDSAGDSAYNGGLAPGVNGGYGWGGPWSFSTQGSLPFVGSSSTNGDGDPGGTGDINTPRSPLGRAWGLTDTVRAPGNPNGLVRPFAGALSPGQTFGIDFDPGRIYPLVDWNDAVVFEARASVHAGIAVEAGGQSKDYLFVQAWTSTGAEGFIDSGVPISSRGAHVELTQLDGSNAQLSVISLADGSSASAILPYAQVVAAGVYNENFLINWDRSYDLYFNNMAITPEPGGLATALLISCGLLWRGRKCRRAA